MSTIWNFVVEHQKIIIPIVTAILSSIVSIVIANRNAKKEFKKLEAQYSLDFEKHIRNNTYDTKTKAIFKALTFLDNYYSWLTIEGDKPIRKDTSTLELTLSARECYNELCLTCDNDKLIKSFNNILFNKENGSVLSELSEFRKCAREELNLSNIEMDSNVCFIFRISTADLSANEKT